MVVGMLICVGGGVLGGAVNGGLLVALRVHPFIITLGTMTIFRGIAFVITNGQSVGSFPALFRSIIRWEPKGLSVVPLMVMLIITALGAVFLTRLAAGRRVYAVGGNE